MRAFLKAYRKALTDGKSFHLNIATSEGSIHRLLDSVDRRDYDAFLAKHTDGTKIRIIKDRTQPLARDLKSQLQETLHSWARTQEHPKDFRVLDSARRIAGNGSLGWPRFMILVRGRKKPFFLDLKLAVPAVAAQALNRATGWDSEAHRVVDLQTRLQYASPDLLQPFKFEKRFFVLREFQSAESRVCISDLTLEELQNFYANAGRLLAWAHLRASGYKGSATTDQLMEFGATLEPEPYLDFGIRCAKRMITYHREFIRTMDKGAK